MSQYKELLAKIELLRIEAEAARIAENAERDLDTKGLPPTVLAYIEATKLAARQPRKDIAGGFQHTSHQLRRRSPVRRLDPPSLRHQRLSRNPNSLLRHRFTNCPSEFRFVIYPQKLVAAK
jgi:hypothetical protein